MLLHLTPKIYNQSKYIVNIESIEIPELKLFLNDHDITARKPYPNKLYLVACRNTGRKAINGIYIETPSNLDKFTVITHWRLNHTDVIKHIVNYTISDTSKEVVTDCHSAFSGYSSEDNLESLPVVDFKNEPPVLTMPRMDVLINNEVHNRGKNIKIKDTYSDNGNLILREEFITIPTIDIERLAFTFFKDKLPEQEDRLIV